MTPVPASKKFWVFDGSVEQYPSVLVAGSVHNGNACTDCHGGTDAGTSRDEAHTKGFDEFARATPSSCQGCHAAIAGDAAYGLHTTLGGYRKVLGRRGFDFGDSLSLGRFEAQCTKCHTADPSLGDPGGDTSCGQCHVSVPDTAGGGLLAGHAFQMTPSTDNNCTACHGSRVKDEYYGQNNALLARNRAALDPDLPWSDAGYLLASDVHKAAGHGCTYCHGADEMHGVGHPDVGLGDRYDVTTAPACEDCHTSIVGLNTYHTSTHLTKMDCQVCHAQPYKNCFGCHTDVTGTGLAFYRINEGDPTLADRKAAASNPATVYPDALMTFRAGRNPRYGQAGQRPYVLLRHVPVDANTFAYTGANEQAGLIPNLRGLSTWKRATPHNIARSTPITSACTNCHGAEYARFWLTSALGSGQGWVEPANEADEVEANAAVVQGTPIPMGP